MSRLFRYIQNDDVLKSFSELKNTVLRERPVVIARYGDYSLFLKLISDNELGITIENTYKHRVIQDRSYDVTETPVEIVSRGVRHACQKMAELSEADVNRMRLQIWKWHLSEWQKNELTTSEIAQKELTWDDDFSENSEEVLDLESFLHGDYLNLGNTLALIEKYLAGDEKHKEKFKKFAIEDIMEMTSEDTKDKSLLEAEEKRQQEGMKKHTYRFTVSVEATDKEHARQALLSYLAGDERIRIQK
jgi:ribosomal protein L20A (L18A)